MLALIVTDQHFGISSNSQADYEWMLRYYKNTVFPIISNYNIKHVIDIGDTFDQTAKLNNSFIASFSRDYLDFFNTNKVTLHVITGNHRPRDITVKNFSGLDSKVFYVEPSPLQLDCGKFFALPWSAKLDLDVSRIKNKTVFAHCAVKNMLANPERSIEKGVDPEFFSGAKRVICGHIHTASSLKNIQNIGSSHYLKWQDVINKETRGAYLINLKNNKLWQIPNKYSRYCLISNRNHLSKIRFENSSPRCYLPFNEPHETQIFLEKAFQSLRVDNFVILSTPGDYLDEARQLLKSGYYKSCIRICRALGSAGFRPYDVDYLESNSYACLGDFRHALDIIKPHVGANKDADELSNLLMQILQNKKS